MKKPFLIAAALALGIAANGVIADEALDELNLGLEHNNVLNVPTPQVPHYSTAKPGKSDRLPTAYSTAPPQIPHRIQDDLPITAEENSCMDCHDRRKLIGKTWKKGKKIPMPDNHYGDFNTAGGSDTVAGARYNCTLCHVPESDAKVVVKNSFN